jgi:hypothetical protein
MSDHAKGDHVSISGRVSGDLPLFGADDSQIVVPSGESGNSMESNGFPAGPTGRFDCVREAVDSGA